MGYLENSWPISLTHLPCWIQIGIYCLFIYFFFEKVWKNCAIVCCTRHSRGEGYPAIHKGNSKSPCECNKVVTAFWSFCRRSHFVFKFPFFMFFTYPISFINIELLWVQTWTKAWILRFWEHFIINRKLSFAQNEDTTLLHLLDEMLLTLGVPLGTVSNITLFLPHHCFKSEIQKTSQNFPRWKYAHDWRIIILS